MPARVNAASRNSTSGGGGGPTPKPAVKESRKSSKENGPRKSEQAEAGIFDFQDQVEETGPVRFVDKAWFNNIIMAGILVNALQMGMELQINGGIWTLIYFILEQFFTLFFLVEMVIKLGKLGPREYFQSKANWLDCVVVIVAVVDNWILSLILGGDSEIGFISILRLVRLSRILKLLRAKRELMMLIEGIVTSIRSMFWLSILLSILVYTVAIVFVKFIGNSDAYDDDPSFDNNHYFGDLMKASVTSMNIAMLMDFESVFRPVLREQPIFALGLLIYMGVSCFGIMNAIIGVIVTRTSQAAADAEAEDLASFRSRQIMFVESIQDIIYEIDEDGDGTVSPEEIAQASDNEDLIEALSCIDLPTGFSMSELHCMLDKDGDGELTKFEFGQGMRRLIFCNDFQRQCLLMLAVAQQKRKLYEMRNQIEEEFGKIDDHMAINNKKLLKGIEQLLDNHVPKNAIAALAATGDKIIPENGEYIGDTTPVKRGKQGAAFDNEQRENNAVQPFTASISDADLVRPMSAHLGPPHGNPSPTAQATAQALAEVSQALAMAAQDWGGGWPDDAVGHAGMARPYSAPAPPQYNNFAQQPGMSRPMSGMSGGPLLPGLVQQQSQQIPNQFSNQPGRPMTSPQQGMMGGMPGQQGMMQPPGSAPGGARRPRVDVTSTSIV